MMKKADTTNQSTQTETTTPRLPDSVVNAVMAILGVAVFILLLPIAIVAWQYNRHIKV